MQALTTTVPSKRAQRVRPGAAAATPWFEVDRAGLAALMERRGKAYLLLEPLQNAFDAPGTSRVDVTLTPIPGRPHVHIEVIDDAPEGFADLAHAFTLFASSAKRADPELRGRFNLGEKLCLALALQATIETTKGTVSFSPEHGRQHSRRARPVGSRIELLVPMTREDLAESIATARQVIPAVPTTINGERLSDRVPIASVEATLPTEQADAQGVMRRVVRRTRIDIHAPAAGATPTLYELGLPVCALEGEAFDVDIRQKVPLPLEREAPSPAYLRAVRAAVLNATASTLDHEQASAAWVSDALSHRDVAPEAVAAAIRARFGPRAVVQDPSDPEANGTAVSHGYTVIPGGAFARDAWTNIRASDAARPAGAVFPTGAPKFGTAKPREVHITPAMARFRQLAAELAARLVGVPVNVAFAAALEQPFAAWYGHGSVTFNVGRLGRAWFDAPLREPQLDLLIHELGHHYAADHTSAKYHDALTRLGARATMLALSEPGLFGK